MSIGIEAITKKFLCLDFASSVAEFWGKSSAGRQFEIHSNMFISQLSEFLSIDVW